MLITSWRSSANQRAHFLFVSSKNLHVNAAEIRIRERFHWKYVDQTDGRTDGRTDGYELHAHSLLPPADTYARQLQRPPARRLFTLHSEPSLGGTLPNMCSGFRIWTYCIFLEGPCRSSKRRDAVTLNSSRDIFPPVPADRASHLQTDPKGPDFFLLSRAFHHISCFA